MKHKDQNEVSKKIFVLLCVITGVFVLSLVMLIVAYIIGFIHSSGDEIFCHVQELKSLPECSVLLSFLTLSFAIAIATPYFISNNVINRKIDKYMRNEFKEDLHYSVENTDKLDAHLSRMIAFNLLENGYYYWAIGWAYRALKRYSSLSEECNKIYNEFNLFIFKNIIQKALSEVSEKKDKSIEKFYDPKKLVYEQESFRIHLRAVKDYIDFKFEVHVSDNKNKDKETDNILQEIDAKMNIVIRELYEIIINDDDNSYNKDYEKLIDNEIFIISRFKDKPLSYKNYFYKNIWYEVFKDIKYNKKEFSEYKEKIIKSILEGEKDV